MTTSNSSPTNPLSLATESTQTLVLLLIYSTWALDISIVAEGFDLNVHLVRYMRASGLSEHDSAAEQNWTEWAAFEADRRVKFLGFCFLNIQTIVYNRPPSLLAREIQLRLPCSAREWQATNEIDWAAFRQATPTSRIEFQDALKSVVVSKIADCDTLPCAFGHMVLLHGLLQRIYFVRQLSLGAHLDDRQQIWLRRYDVDLASLCAEPPREYDPTMSDESEARCRFGINATGIVRAMTRGR